MHSGHPASQQNLATRLIHSLFSNKSQKHFSNQYYLLRWSTSTKRRSTNGKTHPAFSNGSTACNTKNRYLLFVLTCNFYPSITEKLLRKALDFANNYGPISEHECDIIIHAKRSLLFSENVPWEKKTSNDRFDVTMGSFDGAETWAGWLLHLVMPHRKVWKLHRSLSQWRAVSLQ